MATKEKEVKKTMIVTKKCRVKEYGETVAKPVIPGFVAVIPIEDVGYLIGIKCAEVYEGDVEPGEIDKKSAHYKIWESSQKNKVTAKQDEIDAVTAELKETKADLKKAEKNLKEALAEIETLKNKS